MNRTTLYLALVTALSLAGCSSDNNSMMDAEVPVDTDIPIINSVSFEATLRELIAIINAEQLDDIKDAADTLYGPDADADPQGVTFVSSIENPDTLRPLDTYDCSNGGTYLFDNSLQAQGGGIITLNDCLIDGVTYNGSFSRNISDTVRFGSLSSFEVIESSGSIATIDGGYTTFITGGRNVRSLRLSDVNFSASASETAISDYSSEVSINTNGPVRTIEEEFTVTSSFSQNEAITVTTDQVFSTTGGAAPFYETGILTAVAADGSELTVNADTGNIETFQVTINELGAVTSETLSWSDGLQLRCVNSVLTPTEISECL